MIELARQGIPFETQVIIPVFYEGAPVGMHKLDLIVAGEIVIELKAASTLIEVHQAQLLAYLRASNLRVGLLFNFGEVPLGIRRLVNK